MAATSNTLKDSELTPGQDESLKASQGICEHVEVREWSKKEESRLTRKLDFRLVPTAFLLYLLCFIDR